MLGRQTRALVSRALQLVLGDFEVQLSSWKLVRGDGNMRSDKGNFVLGEKDLGLLEAHIFMAVTFLELGYHPDGVGKPRIDHSVNCLHLGLELSD